MATTEATVEERAANIRSCECSGTIVREPACSKCVAEIQSAAGQAARARDEELIKMLLATQGDLRHLITVYHNQNPGKAVRVCAYSLATTRAIEIVQAQIEDLS